MIFCGTGTGTDEICGTGTGTGSLCFVEPDPGTAVPTVPGFGSVSVPRNRWSLVWNPNPHLKRHFLFLNNFFNPVSERIWNPTHIMKFNLYFEFSLNVEKLCKISGTLTTPKLNSCFCIIFQRWATYLESLGTLSTLKLNVSF